jgi:hypothetical protein
MYLLVILIAEFAYLTISVGQSGLHLNKVMGEEKLTRES